MTLVTAQFIKEHLPTPEEQLKKFEESHKKWVESGCWIPKQFYTEKYLDEEDSPKFPLEENRFVVLDV